MKTPCGYMQFFGESYLETIHHQSKYDHDQQWLFLAPISKGAHDFNSKLGRCFLLLCF